MTVATVYPTKSICCPPAAKASGIYLVGVTQDGQAITVGAEPTGVFISLANGTEEPTLLMWSTSLGSANSLLAAFVRDPQYWLTLYGEDHHDRAIRKVVGHKGIIWIKAQEGHQGAVDAWELA